MRNYTKELEIIANDLLIQDGEKPNYSNNFLKPLRKMKMAESCGSELRKLIHTYTGLDTHNIEKFI